MEKRITMKTLLTSVGKYDGKGGDIKTLTSYSKLEKLVDKMIKILNSGNDNKNQTNSLKSIFDYINLKNNKDYVQIKDDSSQDQFNNLFNKLKINYDNPSLAEINLLVSIIKQNLRNTPSFFSSKYNDISLAENSILSASLATSLYLYAEHHKLEIDEQLLKSKAFLMLSFDFSGIQNFVFDIPVEGALGNLRSRSFYLDMIAEILSDQILIDLNLSRAHIVYVGGGHGYLLLPNTEDVKKKVIEKINIFNNFFLKNYDYKLYIGHSIVENNVYDLMSTDENLQFNNSFSLLMSEVFEKISLNKKTKYNIKTLNVMNETKVILSERECASCGTTTKLLPNLNICEKCQQFKDFSKDYINKDKKFYIVLNNNNLEGNNLEMPYQTNNNCYLYALSKEEYQLYLKKHQSNIVVSYIKNNNQYIENNVIHLNFVDQAVIINNRQASINEIAILDKGIKRIAVLKLDIDSLGLVFKEGFKEEMYNLLRMSSLSDKISYYYKNRIKTILEGLNITAVFSGGDDVFLFGTLNDVIKFSERLYIDFNNYTKGKLSFSAGIAIFPTNYPIYKISNYTEDLLLAAKSIEGKNSIAIFDNNQIFKWQTFFEVSDVNDDNSEFNVISGAFSEKLISNSMLYNSIYLKLKQLETNKESEKTSYHLMYMLGRIKKDKNVNDDSLIFKKLTQMLLTAANPKETIKRQRLLLGVQLHLYRNREREE